MTFETIVVEAALKSGVLEEKAASKSRAGSLLTTGLSFLLSTRAATLGCTLAFTLGFGFGSSLVIFLGAWLFSGDFLAWDFPSSPLARPPIFLAISPMADLFCYFAFSRPA